MRIAALYNVFDGEELLPGSIKCLIDHVAIVVIVWQDVSNFGEEYQPDFSDPIFKSSKVSFIKFKAIPGHPASCEKKKRNLGIKAAQAAGCTHFLHLDCDEYYRDFKEAAETYQDFRKSGSVCKMWTYFKSPVLRLEKPENYYVPFIHKLNKYTIAGGMNYPFYVDPTRRINEKDVAELPVMMHHYSWVRKDITRKVRNSTARKNIEKKSYLQDYSRDLKPGDFIDCFQQKLVEDLDHFNLKAIL